MTLQSWQEENKLALMDAVAGMRRVLERHASRGRSEAPLMHSTEPQSSTPRRFPEAVAMDQPSALDIVCATFALSSFERGVLLLCAGMELDASFGACCAAAQADSRRAYPTFGLALAALAEPHWSALTPRGPLRRWRLIEAICPTWPTGLPGLASQPAGVGDNSYHPKLPWRPRPADFL